jgi:hypothetical protein
MRPQRCFVQSCAMPTASQRRSAFRASQRQRASNVRIDDGATANWEVGRPHGPRCASFFSPIGHGGGVFERPFSFPPPGKSQLRAPQISAAASCRAGKAGLSSQQRAVSIAAFRGARRPPGGARRGRELSALHEYTYCFGSFGEIRWFHNLHGLADCKLDVVGL